MEEKEEVDPSASQALIRRYKESVPLMTQSIAGEETITKIRFPKLLTDLLEASCDILKKYKYETLSYVFLPLQPADKFRTMQIKSKDPVAVTEVVHKILEFIRVGFLSPAYTANSSRQLNIRRICRPMVSLNMTSCFSTSL